MELRTFDQVQRYHLEYLSLVVEEGKAVVAIILSMTRLLVETEDAFQMEMVVVAESARVLKRILQATKVTEDVETRMVTLVMEDR